MDKFAGNKCALEKVMVKHFCTFFLISIRPKRPANHAKRIHLLGCIKHVGVACPIYIYTNVSDSRQDRDVVLRSRDTIFGLEDGSGLRPKL